MPTRKTARFTVTFTLVAEGVDLDEDDVANAVTIAIDERIAERERIGGVLFVDALAFEAEARS